LKIIINMENLLSVLVEAQRVASDLGEPIALLEESSTNASSEPKDANPEKPKNWKKPKDMPKRPLSAYNLFFKSERQRIVSSATKGKPMPKTRRGKSLGIGFAGMARNIAGKWKIIPSADKMVFEEEARIEKARYRKEIAVWRSKQAAKNGPPTKKTPTKPKPALPSPTTLISDDPTAFDASGVAGQSLHTIMQENLMRGRHQYHNQMDTGMVYAMDPVPFLSLSSTRNMLNSSAQAGSIVHPFDLTTSGFRPQSRRASLMEPYCQEMDNTSYTQEAVPASCWRALAYTLNDDHFCASPPTDRVHGIVDDLSHFMNTMEEGYW
jgi:hypothetical protein